MISSPSIPFSHLIYLLYSSSQLSTYSKTWGPSRPCWGVDNRTVAVRVVGHGRARRVEVRVAGADAEAHAVLAAIVAR